MMIGEPCNRNPTVYTSTWVTHEDPPATIISSSSASPLSVTTTTTSGNGSPRSPNTTSYHLSNYDALLTALSRYLPSNEPEGAAADLIETDGVAIDGESATSDDFRMYEFKVRRCTRPKAHDWTECPFAHPGEKARRRDPRQFFYSGTACTDFRKGNCRRGDACEFAHGVFECWLHPTRYRTQACKDGRDCKRRVCFFAHSPDQLRVVSGQPSPRSIRSGSRSPDPFEETGVGVELSPPVTPMGRAYGSGTVTDLLLTLRNLQLSKMKSMALGSPRFASARPGIYSPPVTPTRPGGIWYLDAWKEEPVMERVESGRELRARMFEKLSRENRLDMGEPIESVSGGSGPDIGWVSELVK